MKEVTPLQADMHSVTLTENQRDIIAGKIKKMFGHINPKAPPALCPIRDVMALASDKWSILIFLYLGYFPVLRFNELKKKVYGISAKVLSERLRQLEADGYVTREVFPEVPVRVQYGLTGFGQAYVEKLLELTEWAQHYTGSILANRAAYRSRQGTPLP